MLSTDNVYYSFNAYRASLSEDNWDPNTWNIAGENGKESQKCPNMDSMTSPSQILLVCHKWVTVQKDREWPVETCHLPPGRIDGGRFTFLLQGQNSSWANGHAISWLCLDLMISVSQEGLVSITTYIEKFNRTLLNVTRKSLSSDIFGLPCVFPQHNTFESIKNRVWVLGCLCALNRVLWKWQL